MKNVTNKKLYAEIIALIDHSLEGVMAPASGASVSGSQELEQVRTNALQIFTQYRQRTEQEIQALEQLSEWDVFTVAFYGETNAGKSTLIESLRILLGEEEKARARHQFQEIAKHLDLDRVGQTEEEIRLQSLELEEKRKSVESLQHDLGANEKHEQEQLSSLNRDLELKKQGLSWLQKFFELFRTSEAAIAFKSAQAGFSELQANNAKLMQVRLKEIASFAKEVADKENSIAETRKALAALEQLQDGGIIGTGRSDFTLQSTAYSFQIAGQAFQLLDVPGIEGDEKKVQTEVDASVKKAHVVFYMTRKAAPPGSGSEGQEGTIDKIKRQLGNQTEVWAIYNKNATSPRALPSDKLLNEGEEESLKVMESALLAELGKDVFKGTQKISCIPAFYASANCLLPSNSHYRNRNKFLEAMTADQLLERSGISEFVGFLTNDICVNYKEKIRNANLKKIRACLEQGIAYVQDLGETFITLSENLTRQHKSSVAQIDDVRRATKRRLSSECKDYLSDLKIKTRTSIYAYVEADRSNDDFKRKLESMIDAIKNDVGTDLETRFETVFSDMKIKVQSIVEKNKRNVDEIMEYSVPDDLFNKSFSFHLDFKIENGLNVVGILSSLGGAAGLIWVAFLASNPAGWTAATVLGAIGLVFSFYKSVRSFFSTTYKMEQQRASADANLDRVFEKLEEALLANITKASEKLDKALLQTKAQLKLPLEQSRTTASALSEIGKRMSKLKNSIA
jgi:hypothetical protein